MVNESRPDCFDIFLYFFFCEVLPKVPTSIKITCKSRFYRFPVERSNIKYISLHGNFVNVPSFTYKQVFNSKVEFLDFH